MSDVIVKGVVEVIVKGIAMSLYILRIIDIYIYIYIYIYIVHLEDVFLRDSTVYAVLLVVNGGKTTLDVVLKACLSAIPVIVVEGSGRIADIIAYVWRMLHGDM